MAQVPRDTHSPSPGTQPVNAAEVCAAQARGYLAALEALELPETAEDAFHQTQLLGMAQAHATLAVYEELRLQRSSTTKPQSGAA